MKYFKMFPLPAKETFATSDSLELALTKLMLYKNKTVYFNSIALESYNYNYKTKFLQPLVPQDSQQPLR